MSLICDFNDTYFKEKESLTLLYRGLPWEAQQISTVMEDVGSSSLTSQKPSILS
jgi:hypothetical protein